MHPLTRALAALFAACLLIAACVSAPAAPAHPPANQPQPAGPLLTLTYWEEEADDGDVLLDHLAVEFMQMYPHIKVVRVHLSYEELLSRFTPNPQDGATAPDLVRCPGECADVFSQSNRFQPVETVFAPALLARFIPGALAAATVRGVVWGIPDNYGSHLMLIYNPQLVSEVPADTDTWIAQLRTLTHPEIRQYGLVYNLNEPYWLIPWIGGFGGWPLDENDTPTLDTLPVTAALDFTRALRLTDRVTPDAADYDVAFDFFKQGLAAYLIDGDWSLDALKEAGVPFGVATLPRVSATGLAPTPLTSGKYWFVGRELAPDKLAAAAAFADFMTSPRAQTQWLEQTRRLPSARAVATHSRITTDPWLQGSMAQLNQGRGLSPAPEMRCVWSAMRPPLGAMMADHMTPAAAAAAMQTAADVCVAKLRERTP